MVGRDRLRASMGERGRQAPVSRMKVGGRTTAIQKASDNSHPCLQVRPRQYGRPEGGGRCGAR